jgi:hypothetical protein
MHSLLALITCTLHLYFALVSSALMCPFVTLPFTPHLISWGLYPPSLSLCSDIDPGFVFAEGSVDYFPYFLFVVERVYILGFRAAHFFEKLCFCSNLLNSYANELKKLYYPKFIRTHIRRIATGV